MATLKRIIIDGFRNIDYNEISLQKMTALLAPNNYGKSNILDAIMFAFTFLRKGVDIRKQLMNDYTCISINNIMAGKPFLFEMEIDVDLNIDLIYSFSFDWSRQNNKEKIQKSGRIISEYFGIKDNSKDKPKYKTIINRNLEDAKYDSAGRCNKPIKISQDELVLVKLSNLDNWSYLSYADIVLNIDISSLDTISDPKNHFLPQEMHTNNGVKYEYDGFTEFIYALQQKDKNTFDYLVSTLKNLIPTIETVKSVKLSSRAKTMNKGIPYELPDIYEVFVKEKNNNQSTPFRYLSTGTMQILLLLVTIIHANKHGVKLLMIEELENSIHPKLLQSLISAIEDLRGETKILFTSHSTYVAKYLTYDQLYVGLPSNDGLVDFRLIKKSKVKNVLKIAAAGDMSLGEYLFELMLDAENDLEIINVLFEAKSKRDGGKYEC